jgi:hypothetical protein
LRTIEIDGAAYPTVKAFCARLQDEIRALPGHGESLEAFVDSMIWANGLSNLAPPYMIRVRGLRPGDPVAMFVRELADTLDRARLEHRQRRGEDVMVMVQIRR